VALLNQLDQAHMLLPPIPMLLRPTDVQYEQLRATVDGMQLRRHARLRGMRIYVRISNI
jgi:hypothetical protein